MNPYKSPWHRAILSALIRRTSGPERNPERAARIMKRFMTVVSWARAVDSEGFPLDGSYWVRKLTGRVWRVRYLIGSEVRIHAPESNEDEMHSLAEFPKNFSPEGCP